jgi:putative ABC transport system substrate-binding protein
MDHWSRRQFVQGVGAAGLGLLVGCGRLPGQALPARTLPRVGLLSSGSAGTSQSQAIHQGLHELGYFDGQTMLLAERYSDGQQDRLPALATALAQLPVSVIVAEGTEAAQAAQQATRTLPIVAISSDPVGTGLVPSLAHPGGNLTGVSFFAAPLAAKRFELLREVVPELTRAAVVWNPGDPARVTEFGELEGAARVLGIELSSVEVRGPAPDLVGAFTAVAQGQPGALLVLADPLLGRRYQEIVERTAAARLPAMYTGRLWVQGGGLMAYGVDVNAVRRRAAYYVDRILKGTPPADLPVEQPTTFDFVINLKTAQSLGLTIPEHVLLQATEVIQ